MGWNELGSVSTAPMNDPDTSWETFKAACYQLEAWLGGRERLETPDLYLARAMVDQAPLGIQDILWAEVYVRPAYKAKWGRFPGNEGLFFWLYWTGVDVLSCEGL